MTKKQLQAAFRDASTKASDLNAKLNNMVQDDSASVEDIKKAQDELTDAKTRRDILNSQLKSFEDVETEPENHSKKTNILDNKDADLAAKKQGINDFIHSRGAKISDAVSSQVTSTEVGVLIPTEIIYNPSSEIDSVVDLSTLVTKTPVTTPSGKYPILQRATDRFSSVKELAENPKLAEPEFKEIDWSVDTYRGAIPLSEESIADAQVDLTGLVGRSIGEKKVNTYNALIAPVLQSFTAKSTSTDTLVDQIKHILNVDLDPAYSRVIIASQSFYNAADTLKDKNGRYLLQDSSASIATTAGKTLLGVPIYVVGDALLGNAGEQKAFIGDTRRGVLFTDRQQVSLAWEDSKIYGRYLGAAFRFGVKQADEKAGYFITNTDNKPAGGQ
ncbi:phage major capsid protein [Leuconostoc citreum]|uniref:phage major capsid protein n=1 Tax=Leuconostoc citreum TaxID=33964 RepID=UPI0015DA7FCC|nr:phage major capsid protein [Leuconostoc citreum]